MRHYEQTCVITNKHASLRTNMRHYEQTCVILLHGSVFINSFNGCQDTLRFLSQRGVLMFPLALPGKVHLQTMGKGGSMYPVCHIYLHKMYLLYLIFIQLPDVNRTYLRLVFNRSN